MQVALDGGEPVTVTVTRGEHESRVWIDGREVHCRPAEDGLVIDGRREPIWALAERDVVHLHAFGRTWRLDVSDPAERARAASAQGDVATAPMPGTVITVSVSAGDEVQEGQPLLVIESMKMQSEIVAWREGTVERVLVQEGESFDRGAGLVELA